MEKKKFLVDFEQLEKIAQDDATRFYRENPLEEIWLEIEGKQKHISNCKMEEILEWFDSKFPYIPVGLRDVPVNPTPMMKAALFSQLANLIGAYWASIEGKPFNAGMWQEEGSGSDPEREILLH